jgi:hypothetical protein
MLQLRARMPAINNSSHRRLRLHHKNRSTFDLVKRRHDDDAGGGRATATMRRKDFSRKVTFSMFIGFSCELWSIYYILKECVPVLYQTLD